MTRNSARMGALHAPWSRFRRVQALPSGWLLHTDRGAIALPKECMCPSQQAALMSLVPPAALVRADLMHALRTTRLLLRPPHRRPGRCGGRFPAPQQRPFRPLGPAPPGGPAHRRAPARPAGQPSAGAGQWQRLPLVLDAARRTGPRHRLDLAQQRGARPAPRGPRSATRWTPPAKAPGLMHEALQALSSAKPLGRLNLAPPAGRLPARERPQRRRAAAPGLSRGGAGAGLPVHRRRVARPRADRVHQPRLRLAGGVAMTAVVRQVFLTLLWPMVAGSSARTDLRPLDPEHLLGVPGRIAGVQSGVSVPGSGTSELRCRRGHPPGSR